jgi:hypothetical protein
VTAFTLWRLDIFWKVNLDQTVGDVKYRFWCDPSPTTIGTHTIGWKALDYVFRGSLAIQIFELVKIVLGTSVRQLLSAMTESAAVTRKSWRCERGTGRMCDLAPLIAWINAVNPSASQNYSLCRRISSSWLTIVLNSGEIFPRSSSGFLGHKMCSCFLDDRTLKATCDIPPTVPGSHLSNWKICLRRCRALLGLSIYIRHSLN